MLNFGNKEFRNLQEQVLKNAQDIEVLQGRPLLEIEIVDELPETGEAGVLYLVPVEDAETGNLYEEFVWVEEAWEQVGSTEIDLSAYPTLAGDNEFSGTNSFGDVTVEDLETDNILPSASNSFNIGSGGAKYDAGYINTIHADWKVETPRLQSTSNEIAIISTGENAMVTIYPENDAKLNLGKSNKRIQAIYVTNVANEYSSLQLKGKSGITISCDNGSNVAPSTNGQLGLGSDAARWNKIYVSANGIDFGNNAWIQKDGSNRVIITNGGTAKVKVGNGETYFANHIEPDNSNTYDLGRTAMRWNNAYVNYLVDSNNNTIVVDKIATKPDYNNPSIFADGTLNGSGSDTIDMTETGVPEDGLYMFTYGNCQCFLTLTHTMVQNAAQYPIRCTCPMMFNGSAYPGILKIERSADLLTFTVATAGVGNVQPSGFEWKLIRVM